MRVPVRACMRACVRVCTCVPICLRVRACAHAQIRLGSVVAAPDVRRAACTARSQTRKLVMAYIVMAYVVMAYVVMAQPQTRKLVRQHHARSKTAHPPHTLMHTGGIHPKHHSGGRRPTVKKCLYKYGLYSYGLYSHGLYILKAYIYLWPIQLWPI